MKTIDEIRATPRICIKQESWDGCNGWLQLASDPKGRQAAFVASWGGGWDHVSVSYRNRCPTWEEMAEVKEMFFHRDECAMQLHPPESDYVNIHPYVLHIWKPQHAEIPRPPRIFV